MKTCGIKTIIAGICFFLLSVAAFGQSFILQDLPVHNTKFGFRYLRPDFDGADCLSLLSGIYDFSVSIPVSSKLNIEASVPFVTIADTCGWDSTENAVGNIYVGLRHFLKSTAEKGITLSLGVFLPTVSENDYSPYFFAASTNYYEFQKYIPNVMTVYGNIAQFLIKSNGLLLNMEIGPDVWIPARGNWEGMELLVHYGLSAGYRMNAFTFKAELGGRKVITESGNFTHIVALGVQSHRGSFRPGIFYKMYLNEEMREGISGVIGIKFDIVLK